MNNLFQDYINGIVTHAEQAMPKPTSVCPECGMPIDGVDYNGVCGSCSRQMYREESAAIEQQEREANRE